MKHLLTLLFILFPMLAAAQMEPALVPENVSVERSDNSLVVSMTLDFSKTQLPANTSLKVLPKIAAVGAELPLPSVTVAGRSRYFTILREGYDENAGGKLLRYSKKMEPYRYVAVVPFEEWMQSSTLNLDCITEGCCSEPKSETQLALMGIDFSPRNFVCEFLFITPEVEARKMRSIEGSAFVDFKVNSTEIVPDYRKNPTELAKIRSSVDEIRDNSDTRITSMTIHGYASPEGSYANNTRLAEGRTEALAHYVNSLYNFPDGLMKTTSTPEDWDGLCEYLEENPQLDNCREILEIAKSAMAPDEKDNLIRNDYPATYSFLLGNVYPALRHSDYRVEYEVRSYTTPEEIAKVFGERPGDLSLQELYILANSMRVGSDEYADVFETAVRLFPKSEIAACNAAVAALQRGDLVGAGRYLLRAGDSKEAVYARGILAAMNKDYESARQLLEKALEMGVAPAEGALQNLPQ